jgi:protein-tyrosine phosphatase
MFYAFEQIQNFRDLSGVARADGARVRPGALLRSGALDKPSPGDCARLQDELQPWAIVDLRGPSELETAPDQPIAHANYYHLPTVDMNDVRPITTADGSRRVSTSIDLVDDPARPTPEQMSAILDQVYVLLATTERATASYRRFFELLLEAAGRPLLWHCTQGKDRTGVAALLLLCALGFDEATAIQEYMLTVQYFQGVLDHLAADGASAADLAFYHPIMIPEARRLHLYLDTINHTHGSLDTYLRSSLGLGERARASLQSAYLA